MRKTVQKLATLTVTKAFDYDNTVVKTLIEAGFTVVQECNGIYETKYIIAEGEYKE